MVKLIIVFVFILFGSCAIKQYNDYADRDGTRTLRQQEKEERSEAINQAEMYILDYLKAPSTSKFDPTTINCDKINGVWEAFITVDAQNSFGAMIRNRVHVSMTRKPGGVWNLEKIQTSQ